jgi:response regulator RpfG family c-di-GMP phosphodiesterase
MSDELLFAAEAVESGDNKPVEYYKVLIVDDEPEIHKVTKLALTGFTFEGCQLEIINATSAKEAKSELESHPDVAVILLDVVMETDDAGLLLVDVIRSQLGIKHARIILRTGQPGQAPEQDVIVKYDINDYKSKTELTSQKLFTLMHSSLRSYRDIISLERSKCGLRQVIEASKGIFDKRAFDTFIAGALYQLTHLLHLDDAFVMAHDIGVFKFTKAGAEVYEAYDRYGVRSKVKISSLPPDVREVLDESIKYQTNIYSNEHIALYCRTQFFVTVFFITPSGELSSIDKELINIFGENITIGLENIHLEDEVKRNQKEMVYRMGEIVETRSKETGFHVKRVALFSEALAALSGLPLKDIETIKLASPLHDIVKISTPDSIINKPGKLTAD